jgi:hypothetical protein
VLVSKFDNRMKVQMILPSQGEVSYVIALSSHEMRKSTFKVEAACVCLIFI